MKKSKILYIIIFLIIILGGGFFIKKHFDNHQDQIDGLDVPSGTQIDNNNENSSNDDLSKLKIKGYIISINNGNIDLKELMKKTNLEDKTPVYSHLSSSYNCATIIETNQKVGPIYLVSCNYDKEKKLYSFDKNSKQLITEFIQNCDALVFLHTVDSDIATKAILIEKDNKNYFYPLEKTAFDDLNGKYLNQIK